MIKISVIVPINNVEKYISKCLTSLMYQSLKEIEIICINDFSTDASVEIVKKFRENDRRIILLNTDKQSGQSYARNMGLEIAKGEYISFVDSDDWCSLDMFEKMYNRATSNNTDITFCKTTLYDDIEQNFTSDDYYNLKKFEIFQNKTFNANDAKDCILDNTAVIWNKIYSHKFLIDNNLKFQNGFIYEDLPYSMQSFVKADRINIVWENLYFYRVNRRFSTMKNIDKKVFDRIPMVELTLNTLKKTDFFEEKKVDIISWIIDDIFHRYTLLEEKYYQDYYKKMKDFFIIINSLMNDDDRIKLTQKSYIWEEFNSIVKSSQAEFYRFLIEKYKTANERIRKTEYNCSLEVGAIKQYLEQYKEEQENEKREIVKWWKEHTEKTVKDSVKAAIDEQFVFMQAKKDYDLKILYDEMQEKLKKQEYDLKLWQAESVKQVRENLKSHYDWKLEDLKIHYQDSLIKQKDYYENHYLLIKILLKLYKKQEQLKNKIGKLLKKN